MLEAIQNNQEIDQGNPLVQNLIGAIQRRYQHPPRTEDNYDWRLWGLLFQVLAGGRHHFAYNPKHSTYNSTMYDIGKYLDDPTSKWFGFHVIIGDFDNDLDTLMDIAILDKYNRLYSMNGWRIMNEPQKILFQRTARDMFADPSVYNAFVSSVEGAKLRGFLKLTREERTKYKNNPDLWAEAYLEDHPGAFQPSLQATVRKWMSKFSS
jgi:hypothetical protein